MAQADKVERMKQWVMDITSIHYQDILYLPEDSIIQWYTSLKAQIAVSDQQSQLEAREAYRLAIKPPTKSKDLIKWSEKWEQAVVTGQRKKVRETEDILSWFTDFTDVVKPIMDYWLTAYLLAKEPLVQQLTLTYQEVVIDFRKEVRKSIKARNPAGHRIGIQSFGPSFAEKYAD